jgi:hypothetical protein
VIKLDKYEFEYVELDGFWGEHSGNKGGVRINWGCKGIGFGQLDFVQHKDGKLYCANECMSKEFVEAVMKEFINQCEFYDE